MFNHAGPSALTTLEYPGRRVVVKKHNVNFFLQPQSEVIVYKANRLIDPGEELCIDYGNVWFQDFDAPSEEKAAKPLHGRLGECGGIFGGLEAIDGDVFKSDVKGPRSGSERPTAPKLQTARKVMRPLEDEMEETEETEESDNNGKVSDCHVDLWGDWSKPVGRKSTTVQAGRKSKGRRRRSATPETIDNDSDSEPEVTGSRAIPRTKQTARKAMTKSRSYDNESGEAELSSRDHSKPGYARKSMHPHRRRPTHDSLTEGETEEEDEEEEDLSPLPVDAEMIDAAAAGPLGSTADKPQIVTKSMSKWKRKTEEEDTSSSVSSTSGDNDDDDDDDERIGDDVALYDIPAHRSP